MKLALDIPVVETERLRLRGRTLDDFPFFCAMWADPDVTRYIGGKPLTEEETWSKFLRMVGHWAMLGYGYWIVEEKQTGARLGEVGFGDFKRDMAPLIKGEPEVGWVFVPAAHKRGYATEAATAAIEWGDKNLNGARMSCIIDIANSKSVRVAEKCGFTMTGQASYNDEELYLLHRDGPA